ncbi:phosphatidate cytidylyltransferase [Undibacterium sp. TJN25]|uniref:phosphatidate cytidylyltransferase n=1 Tax=Undibacterium sp. TJN25 TaxID=3413056 RepID=UPI003BF2FEE0
MLKTRIATALVLLAVLLPILYFGNFLAFSIVAILFFGVALWESLRLFKNPAPVIAAVVWAALFAYITLSGAAISFSFLFMLCAAFWLLRLVPALKLGLPPFNGASNAFLSGVYSASIFGCFVAIAVLFRHSPVFLLSVMAIVWIADIGAYFSGKAFGKRKLAPTISPGKSWEGAIGGWIAVLLIASLVAVQPMLADTFPARMLVKGGWAALVVVMSILSAASVVGDLFESMLKRRAGMKDSSSLLPGHGGVLDRIDALIPVLPVAALLDYWW